MGLEHADAPRISAREWGQVVRATIRVLRDSNRIEDIHLVSEIMARRRFTELLAAERERDPSNEVLRQRPEIDEQSVDFAALRRLPETTLGGAYVCHLERNGLDVYRDPVSNRFISDPDVRYLVHRYRQTHDIWHVLMGLGTRGHEEVLVHAFSLGMLGLPNSAMIVGLGTLKHIVLERRWALLRDGVAEAYRSGKRAAPLLTVAWEEQWEHSLAAVRERYAIVPTAGEEPRFTQASKK